MRMVGSLWSHLKYSLCLQILLNIFNKSLFIFDRQVTLLDGMTDWLFRSCYQLAKRLAGKIWAMFATKLLGNIQSIPLMWRRNSRKLLKFNLPKCCMDAFPSCLMDQKMVQNCLPLYKMFWWINSDVGSILLLDLQFHFLGCLQECKWIVCDLRMIDICLLKHRFARSNQSHRYSLRFSPIFEVLSVWQPWRTMEQKVEVCVHTCPFGYTYVLSICPRC